MFMLFIRGLLIDTHFVHHIYLLYKTITRKNIMTGKRRVRGNPIPIIVEDHPEDYVGYPFITLIQYRDNYTLLVVDNANEKTLEGYVLDLCGPAKVNEERVVTKAAEWYDKHRTDFPVSFYFSQQGVSGEFSPIYKTYPTEFVTRIIGPMPVFDMAEGMTIKRRRRKPLAGIKVVKRT